MIEDGPPDRSAPPPVRLGTDPDRLRRILDISMIVPGIVYISMIDQWIVDGWIVD
jgi:hypothetical protein